MQLRALYPRHHQRYLSLPIFGSVIESFATWLLDNGYPRHRVRVHLRKTRAIDDAVRRRGCVKLDDLTREVLHACLPPCSQDDADLNAAVRTLERFLDGNELLPPFAPPTRSQILVHSYGAFLQRNRGLAESTIAHHLRTASELLEHLNYGTTPTRLTRIGSRELEAFVCRIAPRFSRESLQHEVSHLRALLRFLASEQLVKPGLDAQLDTPRLYRRERLPRALPWETVQAFLRSIDRKTSLGRRDYAIFLLIATYGLRACEVVALTIDDIDWRANTVHVPQRKTRSPLMLPLTNSVGNALVDYLRRARPSSPYREVFLRARAPAGTLKPTAVTEAFQGWSKRSALNVPYQGAHCLRHAYATHLLRIGIPVKTIGDILGHRSAESTCVYLRLAIEDLRDVALSLPSNIDRSGFEEGQP
jgi:site-specific recombinase XerD